METTATARYQPGDRVKVRADEHLGHHRTPWYIKGKRGIVTAFNGTFVNPESSAHGGSGLQKVPVYLVEFYQTDVWPDYDGAQADKILVDIYEHWLEPA